MTVAELGQACVDNVRPFLTFRLHLRSALQQVPEIAVRRAQGRRQLMQDLAPLVAHRMDQETLGSLLVQIDQLSEAIARGDLSDFGLTDSVAHGALARLIATLRGD